MMKKIGIIFGLLAVACSKVEPIEVIAPQRDIDTETLKKYKSQTELEKRNIVMGMMYNWGKESGAFLMNTPDSLDIVVIKSGYDNITEDLKNDMQFAQEKKATKVLLGVDFESAYQQYEAEKEQAIGAQITEKEQEWKISNERLTSQEKKEVFKKIEQEVTENLASVANQKLEKQAAELLNIVKSNGFDGISVEFPQKLNEAYSAENFDKFLREITKEAGKEKKLLLVVENPYDKGETTEVKPVDSANWIVYRQKGKQSFKNFDEQSQKWASFKYVPSVDFTEEDLAEGFADSQLFVPGGRLNRTMDVLNWQADNKAGVAYYHIEKNYYDKQGDVTFKTLRNAISKLQSRN
ncbi:glycoside hydrolase family 18 [Capnocytophaga stomatis]|uniref:glycoside hydrolase family 18 n=1 Tax=Capnocytophaga stomatis TaxID=1848904 RepID=UPI00385C8FF9